MTAWQVGPNAQFKTFDGAYIMAVDSDRIDVAPDYVEVVEKQKVINKNIAIIGDASPDAPLRPWFRMKRVASLNKTQIAGLIAAGVTQAVITAALAALTYLAPVTQFRLADGTTEQVNVHWWAPGLDKGVFTTGPATTCVRIAGLHISDGFSVELNGAAIRGQGTGLTVDHNTIHDCQMGVLTNGKFVADPEGLWRLVPSHAPGKYKLLGYNHIIFNDFYHNGDRSGMNHDIYIGECLVSVTGYNTHADNYGGHHNKTDAAIFQIIIDSSMPDTDAGLSNQSVDATSGRIYVINIDARKVELTDKNSGANEAEMVMARNDRSDAPFGNCLMVLGSMLESTCHSSGSFIRAVNSPNFKIGAKDAKDPAMVAAIMALGVPEPFTGNVSGNVLVGKVYQTSTGKDDIHNYLAQPLDLPPGVNAGGNTVVRLGDVEPTAQRVAFTGFTDTNALLTDLRAFITLVDPDPRALAAVAYCEQNITIGAVLMSDPADLTKILDLTAQINRMTGVIQATAADLAARDATITDLNAQLAASSNILATKDAVISGLQAQLSGDEAKLALARTDADKTVSDLQS